jgi:hypothetical protein
MIMSKLKIKATICAANSAYSFVTGLFATSMKLSKKLNAWGSD